MVKLSQLQLVGVLSRPPVGLKRIWKIPTLVIFHWLKNAFKNLAYRPEKIHDYFPNVSFFSPSKL